ncbi:basic proline-rich protein-like [Falco biarmicus]|uniref:basic proline-rich protein-like n=1 Tax=Falco biarmicus TaxID=345155 RepID=UPI0024BC4A88|nr:basic proline-rich protein-like [Falco biarmicus]
MPRRGCPPGRRCPPARSFPRAAAPRAEAAPAQLRPKAGRRARQDTPDPPGSRALSSPPCCPPARYLPGAAASAGRPPPRGARPGCPPRDGAASPEAGAASRAPRRAARGHRLGGRGGCPGLPRRRSGRREGSAAAPHSGGAAPGPRGGGGRSRQRRGRRARRWGAAPAGEGFLPPHSRSARAPLPAAAIAAGPEHGAGVARPVPASSPSHSAIARAPAPAQPEAAAAPAAAAPAAWCKQAGRAAPAAGGCRAPPGLRRPRHPPPRPGPGSAAPPCASPHDVEAPAPAAPPSSPAAREKPRRAAPWGPAFRPAAVPPRPGNGAAQPPTRPPPAPRRPLRQAPAVGDEPYGRAAAGAAPHYRSAPGLGGEAETKSPNHAGCQRREQPGPARTTATAALRPPPTGLAGARGGPPPLPPPLAASFSRQPEPQRAAGLDGERGGCRVARRVPPFRGPAGGGCASPAHRRPPPAPSGSTRLVPAVPVEKKRKKPNQIKPNASLGRPSSERTICELSGAESTERTASALRLFFKLAAHSWKRRKSFATFAAIQENSLGLRGKRLTRTERAPPPQRPLRPLLRSSQGRRGAACPDPAAPLPPRAALRPAQPAGNRRPACRARPELLLQRNACGGCAGQPPAPARRLARSAPRCLRDAGGAARPSAELSLGAGARGGGARTGQAERAGLSARTLRHESF